MDIQAAKIKLAKTILETESTSLIEKIQELVSNDQSADFYDDFTEDQKLEIEYGIEQLNRGERISWEDLKKKLP